MVGCTSDPTENLTSVTVPADASMKDLRQEPILEFRPAGVVAGDAIELPADGDMVLTNAITRRFVAESDEALAQAGTEEYRSALSDGWEGPALSDPTSSGVFGTTLSKGEMDLDITYSTSASFDLFDSDEDVLALDISLSTRSSELDDGGN